MSDAAWRTIHTATLAMRSIRGLFYTETRQIRGSVLKILFFGTPNHTHTYPKFGQWWENGGGWKRPPGKAGRESPGPVAIAAL